MLVVRRKMLRVFGALVFCAAAVFVQAQTGGEKYAALISALKELPDAGSDLRKDSLSERIRVQVRTILDADDAFTADLSSIPISRVDAPDGKFRLITWNIPYSNGNHRFEGMLLVKDKNRSVLYELRDMTEKLGMPLSKKLAADNWYGALYYAVIPPQDRKAKFYTLLGWKGRSKVETQKVIEVLSFNGPVPTFGSMVFSEPKVKHARKVYGFSFQTSMSLKWDPSNKAIVFDHLAPMKPEFAGEPALMGPDLSFDAFVWEKGKWVYKRDIDARNMDLNKPHKQPPPEQR
jgi:hypothetical protein